MIPANYYVQIGSMGDVFLCRWNESVALPRGCRVICRTARGLEIGIVLADLTCSSNAHQSNDPPARPKAASQPAGPTGQAVDIIRRMTVEDQLLDQRLERHKRQAVIDCQQAIEVERHAATLLEVEHLFDGRTLVFHFLGEVSDELQTLIDDLATVYERRARTNHFAKLIAEGCGPGCGTKEGGGCGSGGCAVCVVSSGCGKQSMTNSATT